MGLLLNTGLLCLVGCSGCGRVVRRECKLPQHAPALHHFYVYRVLSKECLPILKYGFQSSGARHKASASPSVSAWEWPSRLWARNHPFRANQPGGLGSGAGLHRTHRRTQTERVCWTRKVPTCFWCCRDSVCGRCRCELTPVERSWVADKRLCMGNIE